MTTKEFKLAPFEMQRVQSICKITVPAKYVCIIAAPMERLISEEVIATSTYGQIKP